MNCQASEMPDKFHGLLSSNITLVYLLSIKISPSASKNHPLLCIKHTKCGTDSTIKLKVFKEMVNEFRTKNLACRHFKENYSLKKISQLAEIP